MKLFFDTEFTGLHKNTTLISLGIVSEDGRRFYAEFRDYDKKQVDSWLKENVIDNLLFGGDIITTATDMTLNSGETEVISYSYKMSDSKENIKAELKRWLSQFNEIQFVSDVCHYDFVLLIDMFSGAFDLPKNICPACHDINQDIADWYRISEKEAFDKSREEIVSNGASCRKHNALYDAEIIKAIYEKMRSE